LTNPQRHGGWPAFVRAAALAAPPATFDRAASTALLRDCEPSALADWLRGHRVDAAAAQNLRSLQGCPAALRGPLDEAARANALRALAALRTLHALGEAFGAAGIPWACLKGAVLVARYYGGLPVRHAGDVDVLIAPGALAEADRCLRALGYAPAEPAPSGPRWLRHVTGPGHEVTYRRPGATPIELHHRLHPNPALIPLRATRLLGGDEHVLIGHVRVPALDPTTEILYLATHGARHAWHRLQWVLDVAMITLQPAAPLAEALVQARGLGVERPLLDGLLLAHALFGTPLPYGAAHAVRRSRRLRYLHGYSRLSLQARRDTSGLPVGREHSSFIASLCQADGLRYAAYQAWLRARHEIARWGARRHEARA
jgi:hypothetical protein